MEDSKDVWSSVSPSIIVSDKHEFNRSNLRKYFASNSKNITEESLLEFFDAESLKKADSETGDYLTHLLFKDGYACNYFNVMDFIFKYISPYEVNRNGELYLNTACKARQFTWYKSNVIKLLKDAIDKYSIDVNATFDIDGNSLLIWLYVNYCAYNMNDIIPFFTEDTYNNTNKNGINIRKLNELSYELYSSDYFGIRTFSYKEEGNNIILTTAPYIYHLSGRLVDQIDKRYHPGVDNIKDLPYYNVHKRIFAKEDLLLRFLEVDRWYAIAKNKDELEYNDTSKLGTYYKKKK